MAINPRGQLPAFRDGDVVVNESFAAIIYLEEKYESGTQLLPKDPAARALVRLQDQGRELMVRVGQARVKAGLGL